MVFLPYGNLRRYTQHQQKANRSLSFKLPNWDTWPENRPEAIAPRRLVGGSSLMATCQQRTATMVENKNERPKTISTDDAREGVTGHNVRYVLGLGLAGAILALIAVGVYFWLGY
jgi:hypothetical protein